MTHPELYLLRHGETEWNAEGRMQGWLNSPLTEKGHMDAARQFEILRGRDLTGFQVLCSPTGRAFQTAAIALGTLVAEIRTDDRLREIGVGEWSGRLRSQLPMEDGPDAYLRKYDAAPGGEGMEGLRARVSGFLEGLDRPSVLVSHGITIRMIRLLLAGDEAARAPAPDAGQGVVFHLKDGVQSLLR